MKKYIAILLFILPFLAKAQYNPSVDGVTVNSPIAPAQQIPTDARSWYHDRPNFLWRPFQSTAEAISWIPQNYRAGNFPVWISTGTLQSGGSFLGGQLFEYMWRRGIADTSLVLINIDGGTTGNFLQVANNLSDVANVATARTNLGLGSMALLNSTAGGDLSGVWPNITVAKFNGLPPAYYLNYNNLTNQPNIPPPLNPIAGANITISGTYPNLTWSATSGASTAGYAINPSLLAGGVVAIDSANFHTVNAVTNFDSLLIIHFNGGALDTLILPVGGGGGGGGTVTSVAVTPANGVSASVANPSTAANLTFTLGAITPTTVNGLTFNSLTNGFSIQGGTTPATLTVPSNATVSGTNTGNVTLTGLTYLTLTGQQITEGAIPLGTSVSGTLLATNFGALTGDVTNSVGSYATTISNNAVTFAKMQQINGATLLGNHNAGVANVESIGLGYGMQLNGTLIQIDTFGTGYFNQLVTYGTLIRKLDSALSGLDTTHVIAQGPGTTLIRGSNDTLYGRTLVAGSGIIITPNPDSSITISSTGSGFSDTTLTVTSNYTVTNTYKSTRVIFNATSGTVTLPDPTLSANRNLVVYVRAKSSGQTVTVGTAAGTIETTFGTFASTVSVSGAPMYKWTPNGTNWILTE